MVLEAPFEEEITEMAITKLLDTKKMYDSYYEDKVYQK